MPCLLPPDTPHDNVDRLAAAAAAGADGEKPSSDGRRVNATIATVQAAHALVVVRVMMFLPVIVIVSDLLLRGRQGPVLQEGTRPLTH